MERGTRRAADLTNPMIEARGAGSLGHHLRELSRHERLGWASVHRGSNHQNRTEILFETGRLSKARTLAERTVATSTKIKLHFIQSVPARTATAQGDLEVSRRSTGFLGDRSMLDAHNRATAGARARGLGLA